MYIFSFRRSSHQAITWSSCEELRCTTITELSLTVSWKPSLRPQCKCNFHLPSSPQEPSELCQLPRDLERSLAVMESEKGQEQKNTIVPWGKMDGQFVHNICASTKSEHALVPAAYPLQFIFSAWRAPLGNVARSNEVTVWYLLRRRVSILHG